MNTWIATKLHALSTFVYLALVKSDLWLTYLLNAILF